MQKNDQREGTHHWHCIMESNGRRIIKVPNRPEGFQFPLSLPSNGSGISEMRWREWQVREKRSPLLMLLDTSGIRWILIEALMTEAHCNIHPAKISTLSLAVGENSSVYCRVELCRSFIICMNWLWHSDTLPKLLLQELGDSGLEKRNGLIIFDYVGFNGFTFWVV